MANVAKLNSSGALFATVRAACDAMAPTGNDGVTILTSCIGGAGFGLIAKTSGTHTLYGAKQEDGSYPVLISLGVNDSGADRLTYGKAIVNIESDGKFGNFTARGAEVSSGNGGNGAGIRINAGASKVVGRNFVSTGNQDGLLTDGTAEQELLFEDFVLDKCGFGREGYTHNAYFGLSKQVTLRRGEITNGRFGHDLKSRSLHTKVEQCRMSGSAKGRAFDYSNGGIWESEHSEYIKPDPADQGNLVHLAPEGIPDGRPESYTSVNDLFQIDLPDNGRGLEFVKNEGHVECVLTDPKFVLNGKVLTDDEARPHLIGNIRIVSTGGPRGPQKPVGCAGDIRNDGKGTAPVITEPSPAAPAPVPPVVAPSPSPVAVGGWELLGNEGASATVAPNTTVRYGANGVYVTKVISGAFTVDNATFGDPISGVKKAAEQFVPSVATTPAPTPPAPVVTAPTPAPVPPVVAPAPVPEGINVGTAMVAGAKAFLETLGYKVTK